METKCDDYATMDAEHVSLHKLIDESVEGHDGGGGDGHANGYEGNVVQDKVQHFEIEHSKELHLPSFSLGIGN